MSQPRIIVGMPAFNEARYIGSVILQARQHADEVIVVDDGSADNTAGVARLAGATVVRHDKNEGYGSTIRRLLSEARQRQADILVVLDAAAQHKPDESPPLGEGTK